MPKVSYNANDFTCLFDEGDLGVGGARGVFVWHTSGPFGFGVWLACGRPSLLRLALLPSLCVVPTHTSGAQSDTCIELYVGNMKLQGNIYH